MINILNVLITSFSDITTATTAAWASKSVAVSTQTVELATSDSIMEHWTSIGGNSTGRSASHAEKTTTTTTTTTTATPLKPRGLPKLTHDATGQRLYYLTTLKVPPNTPVLPASAFCQPLRLPASNEQHHDRVVTPPSPSLGHDTVSVLEADSCTSTEPPSSTASSFDLSFSSMTSDMDDPVAVMVVSDSSFSAASSVGTGIGKDVDFGGPTGNRDLSLKGVGLGLSGFTTKGSDKPFDGLGLVDIHGWVRQFDLREGQLQEPGYDHDHSCYGSTQNRPPTPSNPSGFTGISSTFLQETLHTFTDDPFHEQSLDTIPECRSWCEVDCGSDTLEDSDGILMQSLQRHGYETSVYPIGRGRGAGVLPRPRKHFSSATISSNMKRVAHPMERTRPTGLRARASTWPTSLADSTHRFGATDTRSLGWRV